MSAELAIATRAALPGPRVPVTPWRDPHTVPPETLAATIRDLELQCRENPESASLHTCLGMAYAMNFDAYKSMDVLEKAVSIDPNHFWAQMKYAELLYRLRALLRAEEETIRALDLASDAWEEATARKQLQEIRRLTREGTQKPAWTKPLLPPLAVIAVMLLLLTVTNIWR